VLEMQDPKVAKNSPSGHHRTTLSGYISATKALIDNWKNMLNSNVSPTCFHNMVNVYYYYYYYKPRCRWCVWEKSVPVGRQHTDARRTASWWGYPRRWWSSCRRASYKPARSADSVSECSST